MGSRHCYAYISTHAVVTVGLRCGDGSPGSLLHRAMRGGARCACYAAVEDCSRYAEAHQILSHLREATWSSSCALIVPRAFSSLQAMLRSSRVLVLALLASASAFHLACLSPVPVRSPVRTRHACVVADGRGDNEAGPWADIWAKYVLLRPGMTYGELKEATLRRNRLSPEERIPGTFRTVVIVHAICFLAAIPILVTNDAIFPKLLQWAVTSRAAAGFGAIY